MPETLICELPDRALIALSGDAARTFLQGLVTSDMTRATPGQALYAALLTPQGKILFDFFIIEDSAGFLIDCAAVQRDDLARRLTFYKLRANVDIAPLDDGRGVYGVFSNDEGAPGFGSAGSVISRDDIIVLVDPRTERAGLRIVGAAAPVRTYAAGMGAGWTGADAYEAHRTALGLADTARDIGSGVHFPHDCNFDHFNGVDFRKGCYVGQEVVSRMHHKTTIRKRMLPVSISGRADDGPLEITADGKPVGTLLSRAGSHGIALVRTDRVQKAVDEGTGLAAGDAAIMLDDPLWSGGANEDGKESR